MGVAHALVVLLGNAWQRNAGYAATAAAIVRLGWGCQLEAIASR